MPLRREVFINDRFYHIVVRGFNKQPLFLEDRDYLRFLLSAYLINNTPPNIALKLNRWDDARMIRVLNGEEDYFLGLKRKPSPLVKVSTLSLMKNHAHFLLKQVTSGGIQAFAQRLQNSFAKFFNIRYEKRGPVFEKAFRAVPIKDDRQFRYVVGYITLNVLDAAGIKWRKITLQEPWIKIRRILDSYPWSSYHYFMGKSNLRALIEGDFVKESFSTPKDFEKHLKSWQADEIADF